MKQRKGELLAEEIGGDLQRQRFDSNVVVDSGVFCTSTRSVISAEAVRGMLEAKGFGKDRAIFVGASRTTCAEAGAAGVFNVLARTAHQADSQITDVACVVDGFGGGGGLTLRGTSASRRRVGRSRGDDGRDVNAIVTFGFYIRLDLRSFGEEGTHARGGWSGRAGGRSHGKMYE